MELGSKRRSRGLVGVGRDARGGSGRRGAGMGGRDRFGLYDVGVSTCSGELNCTKQGPTFVRASERMKGVRFLPDTYSEKIALGATSVASFRSHTSTEQLGRACEQDTM